MSQNDNQLPSNSHSPRQPPQNDTQSTAPQQQQDGVQITPDLIALIQHIHTENTRLYTQIQSETTRLYQQIQHEHTQLYQQIQTENTRLYQQLQAENARRDHMLMQSLETLQNLSHGLQSYVESAGPPPPYPDHEEDNVELVDAMLGAVEHTEGWARDILAAPQFSLPMPSDWLINGFYTIPIVRRRWERALPLIRQAQQAHRRYLQDSNQNPGQPRPG